MGVKENLIAARALIDTPEKWIKGSYKAEGCFCVLGAARSAWGNSDDGDQNPIAAALKDAMTPEQYETYGVYVHKFNDHPDTTHPMIMALFDRAIAACDERVAA